MQSLKQEKQVLIPPDIDPETLFAEGRVSESVTLLEGETMGTYWRLHLQRPSELSQQNVVDEIEWVFQTIIAQMSHWSDSSELSRLNKAEKQEAQKLSNEFYIVLKRALEIAKLTAGAYDPSVGKLMRLNGFGPESTAEDSNDIDQVRCDWKSIHLDPVLQTAKHCGECHLDLSSIAKGYAVDLACEALERKGVNNYLLEVGGEFRGAGCKPDLQPWWVEIDSCEEGNHATDLTLVALSGISLATSGSTIQRKIYQGEAVHHLIDTQTGRPTQSSLLSVSVIAKNCMDADAWATAFYVMGVGAGMELAATEGIAACFISVEDNVIIKNESAAYLQFQT
ncbi:MAG: FAD:protein FMN transferase [Akkermansiaceae bacterium]